MTLAQVLFLWCTYNSNSNNSKLLIKDVNINPSRIGVIKILKKMGAQIFHLKIKEIIKVKKFLIFLLKVQKP